MMECGDRGIKDMDDLFGCLKDGAKMSDLYAAYGGRIGDMIAAALDSLWERTEGMVERAPSSFPASKKPWTFKGMTEEDERASFDGGRQAATDLADKYKSPHLVLFDKSTQVGHRCFAMLTELVGKPWNNMALNMVHGLRPSCIRVTTGVETCDSVGWRVTVHLEEDKRTIQSIHQEVDVGLVGCRYGADVRPLEAGEVPEYRPTQTVFVNTRALAKGAGPAKEGTGSPSD